VRGFQPMDPISQQININQMKIMKTTLNNNFILIIISRLFFALFMYTAVMKVIDHDKFELEMGKSPIITDYAHILVWAVPVGEIILAVLAYFRETMMIGLYASLSVMSLFTAYLYAILNFSDFVPCACMGVFEKMGFEAHLVFNIAFMILAIIGIFLKDKTDKATIRPI